MVVERGKLKEKLAYLIRFHASGNAKPQAAPPRPKAATR
jgi:hypothetical protein